MIPNSADRGLFRGLCYIYKYPDRKFTIPNPMAGVEVDYYFMATRFAGSNTSINMSLWTVAVDAEGDAYGMYTNHIGHYHYWEEVIKERIESHLLKLEVDALQVRRMLRELIVKKEGHIIPYDARHGGTRIGIDGSDELFVRRDRFNILK